MSTPDNIYERSSTFHREPTPGKIKIVPTKPLQSQDDLSLAYSPGVAGPCLEIAEDPAQAAYLTSRGNLIAVVTNGTAVLGLGNIGPLAAKPVMEGKAVLFKKFADIDAIDIEIKENDPDKLIDIIASLEPSFGGINLEDIKAPECFYIEKELSKRVNIPVFHDDQHGTAIIVCAAITNGLNLIGKKIEDAKIVTSGAGAAAIACIDLLVEQGIQRKNVTLFDSNGVVYKDRPKGMNEEKNRYAVSTSHKDLTLGDAMKNADIFLGLSTGGLVTKEMVAGMPSQPIILALANPEPEISPNLIKEVREDAIIATGRSDFPNQVNNVLCFPYIFRGALDVGATTINNAMKTAAIKALANLAHSETSDIVANAYGGDVYIYGPNYIIPKPFDPRLAVEIPYVVAKAAMESGVATRPIEDLTSYRQRLLSIVYRTSMVMKPLITQAKSQKMKITYAEGEDERVLRAVQTIVDEEMCHPILIGRPNVIQMRIERLGLRLRPDVDFDLIDPNNDSRYLRYWTAYHEIMERNGVSPDGAKFTVRTNPTVIAALTVHLGDADSMVVGTSRMYHEHLKDVLNVLQVSPDHRIAASLGIVLLDRGIYFFCDPYVNLNPNAEDIVDMTLMAAEQVKRFGIQPKIAVLSHSNFGSGTDPEGRKMKRAVQLLKEKAPDLDIEGEMHADVALMPQLRKTLFPNSLLKDEPNLLIMPSIDTANIAFHMSKVFGNGLSIGPILMGTRKPGHIVSSSITVRGLINVTALAAVDAQIRKTKELVRGM